MQQFRRQFRRQLPGPSVIALLALAAPAQNAVSPAGRAQCEGSSFTHFPLGRPNARFQFLYADVPPQMVLHGMAYRREAVNNHGHVDAFNADLQVTLSIAPLAPPQTSGTFANNVGTAATVVLPRTVLSFPATERPPLDPAATFDLAIPFAVPFTMPAAPATLCVDIAMFGNTSPAGTDRSLSIYLDSHDYVNGRQEQPGYELGAGCAAPGSSTPMTAALSLWHLGTSTQFDLSMRNGVPDDGSLQARTFLCLGANLANVPWPGRSPCALLTTTDVWFAMPGNDTATGSYDGSLTGLPVLPPGFRLWCQAGSVHLGNGALAFSDASTLVTPPPPPAQAPFARVSASTDRTAATGAVSFVVPVTQFF